METELGEFLNRLREISESVLHATEARELHVVLDRIAHVARELAGTRYAALGVPDGLGGLRYFRTSGMTPEEIAMIDHLPRGHGLLGAIMSDRRVIRLDNITDDPRSSGFPANHPPMASFLGVPIQVAGRLYGMLYLCDKRNGSPFNEIDELLVQTMASYAALAISGAEVATQSHQIQLLEERERIGMALHDGVIQSLYGIGMKIDVLRDTKTIKDGEIDSIIDNLDGIIEDVRGFIGQLVTRPAKDNLRSVLESAVRRVIVPRGVTLNLDVPPVPLTRSAADIESLALIVREGISNALRHGRPSQVTVHAEVANDRLFITISDNGRGFDVEMVTEQSQRGGMGLENMRQRTSELGGSLVVDSTMGSGTRLLILLPQPAPKS